MARRRGQSCRRTPWPDRDEKIASNRPFAPEGIQHRIVAKPTGVPDLQTGLVAPGPREFEREQRIGRIRGEAPVAGGSPQPSAVCAFEDDRRRDRLAADPHDVDAAAPAPGSSRVMVRTKLAVPTSWMRAAFPRAE